MIYIVMMRDLMKKNDADKKTPIFLFKAPVDAGKTKAVERYAREAGIKLIKVQVNDQTQLKDLIDAGKNPHKKPPSMKR